MRLIQKTVSVGPSPDDLLETTIAEIDGIEVVPCAGKIVRPTAGAKAGDLGVPMYLGITQELERELGIAPGELTQHVGLTLIEGFTTPARYRVYLLSAVVDDARFREYAAKGLYKCFDIDAARAEEIIAEQPIDKNSISLPTGVLGSPMEYFVFDARKNTGKLISTTLPLTDYEKYSSGLRKGKDGKSGWEGANVRGLPTVVVPNGVAKLLGQDFDRVTNLTTDGKDKTVAAGAVCKLRYGDGEVEEVFVVGARDHLGVSSELRQKIGLQLGQEYNLQIVIGQKELIVEHEVESIVESARDQVELSAIVGELEILLDRELGEFTLEEQLIARAIKENSSDSKVKLGAWLDAEEKKLKDERGNLILNLRRARIYYAAGMFAEAMEDLEDSSEMANQPGGHPDLLELIDYLMQKGFRDVL